MAKKEAKIDNKKEKKSKKDKTSFFKSFKAELKKVSWPTPKQLVNNTTAVVVIVLILAAIIFVLDSAFGAVNKYGIDNIKKSVVSTEDAANASETEENVDGEVDSDELNVETPDDVTTVTE
ncbi:MAG: preprotein translocase subunit SecE [Clostridia bacterium]|nr:preprotein translocase subunit SecE [Clostridia bacterium]